MQSYGILIAPYFTNISIKNRHKKWSILNIYPFLNQKIKKKRSFLIHVDHSKKIKKMITIPTFNKHRKYIVLSRIIDHY